MSKLKSLSNSSNVAGLARLGIKGEVLGVSINDLRALAKELGVNQELALKLFAIGVREAKILASYIADPDEFSSDLLDEWVVQLGSWEEVDQVSGLFLQTGLAREKIREWVRDEREFVRRTAFSMIAWISVRDKELLDSEFKEFLELIKKYSTDERHYVRKAVDWALRSIGKRNLSLNKKAVAVAKELLASGDKTATWIGKHALKELTSERVQDRLKK